MNTQETKEILHSIKQSLEELLLSDRAHLNALMRRTRQRIHDRKPTDALLRKMMDVHQRAKQRIERRKAVQLKIEYPDILPVSAKKDEIRELIEENQVVIVCGTTGSGKTTQLPKIVREAGAGTLGRIGITQPRRLAATGMARRVAEEMQCDYGKGVGCQVRFDDKTCDDTLIKFMTDGILLAETQRDRHLLQYDCLVIDEAHERSLNIDFILGYLKNLLKIRTDLKVVISSATLDAASFSTFFDDAPVIEVEGRTYPVEDLFLPPGPDEELSNHILRAAHWISDVDQEGDILIFLPGEREIRDATKKLSGQHFTNTEVLPLYGRLSMGDQQRVFKPGSKRRIILATNVAETSITIPRIHYVIDSGLVRLSRFNPRTQVQGLQIEQVSQASARQRRGRCGRVTDGICVYLYEKETLEESAEYTDPEIRRTSLAGVILQMDLLGLPPIDQFPLIDPPQPALVREGYRALQDIGAIDEERQLTKMGRDVAAFSVDPHLARMIVQARDEGALPEILVLVSFLSIQDVRERPAEKAELADQAHRQWAEPRSDFMAILNLWNFLHSEENSSHGKLRRNCKKNFLNYRRVQEWRNLWKDLRNTIRDLKWKPASTTDTLQPNYDLIHRSLLAGLPANIGLRSENREFQAARNRKFFIFPGSFLFKKPPEWVMTFSLVETTKLYARIVAEIDPAWLESVAPHLCKSTYQQPAWNVDAGFVYAKESIVSGGLTLVKGRNVHFGPINPELSRELFIKEALVPGNIKTRGGWLKIHQRMLDDIAALEEKIRRPGSLLDSDAIQKHFDQLLPEHVYSTKSLENWIRKKKARIAMRLADAVFPNTTVSPEDFPDALTFHDETFTLLYTFEPGEELDGMALVCPTDKLIFLPDWAPEWLVPGWLPEKVNRLLRTLPKNLRITCNPLDQCISGFLGDYLHKNPPAGPLLDSLSLYLQQHYSLPVDGSDFDESVLPEFLRMKVIETRDDQIIQIHADLSTEHRMTVHRNSTQTAFAKWTLPPQQRWPGDAMPEFIVSNDREQTRGYPALSAAANGVGREVFLEKASAHAAHSAGLAKLFRLQQPDQVRYVEKRPPFPPTVQFVLTAIDSDFLSDFFDVAMVDALTKDGTLEIRDASTFDERAIEARAVLYETAVEMAQLLEKMLADREKIMLALDELPASDSQADIALQMEFLFRPGFLTVPDLFPRYARYLRAAQLRIQRMKNNPQADLKKLQEIIPFQDQLNDKLLECEDIASAHTLLNYSLLLEEFRVNRFAPEIKTPQKISARRLEDAWAKLY